MKPAKLSALYKHLNSEYLRATFVPGIVTIYGVEHFLFLCISRNVHTRHVSIELILFGTQTLPFIDI